MGNDPLRAFGLNHAVEKRSVFAGKNPKVRGVDNLGIKEGGWGVALVERGRRVRKAVLMRGYAPSPSIAAVGKDFVRAAEDCLSAEFDPSGCPSKGFVRTSGIPKAEIAEKVTG